MDLLKKFLNKSFAKLAPNCTVKNSEVTRVVATAAETQDYLENTTKKLGNKPNADIIFRRISQCDVEKLKLAFIFVLEFMIKRVKEKFNKRGWTLAIDTHYEPFYGSHKNLWIHGYKPKEFKDCTGSYCYITISVVVGDGKFTLLVLPVHLGQDMPDLIEELINVAKQNFKVRTVLFDRGFDSGANVRRLKQLDVKFIIFARKNDKIKRFMDETPSFKHKYFYDKITWNQDKSKQTEPTKYLIIKDYVDLRNFKIYDWAFITNLSNLQAISYVHIYRKRWAIENTYKQFKTLRIKTTSTNHIIRYFLFVFVTILYNLWKFHDLALNVKTRFKEFTFKLFLASIDIHYMLICKEEINNITKQLNDIQTS